MTAVRALSLTLVTTFWISAVLFGAYILAYYGGAIADRDLVDWNAVLPRVYEPSTPAASVAIGLHFGAGAVILVLGCLQLVEPIRDRWPLVQRRRRRLQGSCLRRPAGPVPRPGLRAERRRRRRSTSPCRCWPASAVWCSS